MAHGKKKWIRRYDGKIKRSNDRTKKDYYGDLKWWDENYYYSRWRLNYRYMFDGRAPFCPQCKHIQKPIMAERAEQKAINDAIEMEYDKQYGEARKAWDDYHRSRRWVTYNYRDLTGKTHTGYKDVYDLPRPKIAEPDAVWKWGGWKYQRYWHYDVRSHLCFKCEKKYEEKNEMWYRTPGCKRRYTWTRRQEYRDYRNEVKAVMQKAKYDEEYYDDIPAYKRGWLD